MLQTYNNGSKLSEANTFQMDQASIRFRYYVITKRTCVGGKWDFFCFSFLSNNTKFYYLGLFTNPLVIVETERPFS